MRRWCVWTTAPDRAPSYSGVPQVAIRVHVGAGARRFMPSSRYFVHGLVIDSPVAIHAAPAGSDAIVDVTIRGAAGPFDSSDGPVEVLLETRDDDGSVWVEIHRRQGHHVMTYPGIAEFYISPSLDELTFWWADESQADTGTLLLEGSVLAVLVALRGACVLHASAVELPDGRALAVVGPSGAGKSTMATMLAIAGCPLVADDVLAVDLGPGARPLVASGIQAARLRESAWGLAAWFEGASAEMSTDDRLVVSTGSRPAGTYELAEIWVPQPDRTAETLARTRLDQVAAFKELMPNLRVPLQERAYDAKTFAEVVELVARVPVSTVSVPWGPPWCREALANLGDEVRMICAGV